MSVISCFVREQKRYTKNEIIDIFDFQEENHAEKFIKNLKSYGVLKTVKNDKGQLELSDLVDEDLVVIDELAGNDDCFYVFTYVGVITVGARVIKVLPKYMISYDKNDEDTNDKEKTEDMKIILKVLERYNNSNEQIVNVFNGSGDSKSFNKLAVILFLLNDYYEYGLYTNEENIIEVNGEGAILWDKTINESFAYIQNNDPYYMEYYTSKSTDDNTDYFRKLHECILTECSKEFDIDLINLSNDKLSYFGDTEKICYKLLSELNVQFNTRKQILLKTLYSYVSQNNKMMSQDHGISMFGTTAFNMVWEKACADVFDNKLNYSIGSLGLNNGAFQENGNIKLIDVIEKPKWKIGDKEENEAKSTLIPDLVCVERHNNQDYFVLLDAKYYLLEINEKGRINGNPGVGDVTKQYLYQLAYKKLLEENDIDIKKNCFLMPSENDKIKNGQVRMDMLEELGLENIQVRIIPAKIIFDNYLNRNILPIEMLNL